jgi:hypothetical protein
LWESASFDASEDVDRIYGIRGVSPKFYRDNIVVDYAIDHERLMRKVMTLLINKDRSLNVLCYFHAYTSESLTPSPSWLRDLRRRNPGISPEMYACDKGRKCNAEIVNNILRTRGVHIGRVAELKTYSKVTSSEQASRRLNGRGRLESDLEEIELLAVATLEQRYPSERPQARDNRFLEMVAGRKQQALEQLGQDFSIRWRRHFWKRRIEFEKGMAGVDEWQRFDEAFSRIFARLIGRSVFTTIEGNLGLGPRDMRKDDLVCVLYGCRLPVVLRKDNRYFRFIGPAYVDGAMNGEFVGDGEKGDRFWIR